MLKRKMPMLLCGTAAIAVWLVLLPGTANAGYLDPGSGSTLAQVVIALLAGFKRIWANLTAPFARLFKK